jgi:ribosomal protein L14E/L6E/L27E
MILIILMTIWFATLAALAVRIAIVRRERAGTASLERSPHLLDTSRDSLRQAINEAMEATPVVTTPVVSSSESATAEHVRDSAQENLYVGP